MPVTIHAGEKALFKIFSNDFAFTIPPYQRPYAWTTEQASELLTDLLDFLENGSHSVEEVNPYFLGSIVLIKKEDSPEADIVDGQQRLATLTILLAVMRTSVQTDYAAELTKYIYEKGDLIVGTPNRYRLKLRERDEEFFRKYIQDEKGVDRLLQLDSAQLTDSQKNIQANAEYFTTALANFSESQRVKLLQYLMQRCFLVVVSTPDLDSAYRIFSVLNSTGLDLRLSDLLKSEIIGAIPTGLQEKYTKIWEQEEEDLGRETFQELFAHIRMISLKAKLRQSALKEFRTEIQPKKEPQKFIDEVIKPYSDSLEIIKTATYQSDKGAEAVNSLFRWLNQIDNFDWVPPAIVYLSENLHFPDKLKQFFSDLERLAAGLMILRTNINDRTERYGRLLTAMEENANLYATDSPLQLTPVEASQIVNTLNGDLYLIRRIRQYVLLRLDSALAHGEATYDYPIISVEHVLPQNPSKGSVWLDWFPVEEERAQYTHRIGNLVLLSRIKNAQAQNFDFDKKKKGYFATSKGVSPFALTSQVLQKSEWTPAIINQRQKELLQKLITLWRLSPNEVGDREIAFERNTAETMTKESHSQTVGQVEYVGLFKDLVERLKLKLGGDYSSPQPRSYFQIPTGINHVHYEWAFHRRAPGFGVELHFERGNRDSNLEILSRLEEYIPRLEKALHERVKVQREWGRKWSRLYVERGGAQITDELKEWAVEKMAILINTLQPSLHSGQPKPPAPTLEKKLEYFQNDEIKELFRAVLSQLQERGIEIKPKHDLWISFWYKGKRVMYMSPKRNFFVAEVLSPKGGWIGRRRIANQKEWDSIYNGEITRYLEYLESNE